MNRTLVISLALVGAFIGARAAISSELPDPTRPLGRALIAPAPVSAPAPAQAPARVLQSILVSPQRRLAIISGRTVGVGDHVGEAVVVEILPYEVVLRRGREETRMRLMSSLDKRMKE